MIPEKETPNSLRDFRSIALLNSSFKIISKILTNKLSPIIGQMIGDYQQGFIKSCSILQGIAIAKEIIHHYCQCNFIGYLLKLDFKKAYDIVSWGCLLKVLRFRGFDSRWISWVEIRLYTAKVQVLVNGALE